MYPMAIIYVLSKIKKNIKIFQLKIFNFYTDLGNNLNIAWACFCNVLEMKLSYELHREKTGFLP